AMAPAEVAGVMFTADPVSGSRERILIEAAPGLGEALVLGKVTPDHFVLARQSFRIVEQKFADQGGKAKLGQAQLEELAKLGVRVEAYFGVPSDIEWALAGGQFYLLQSRPIKQAEREHIRQEEIAALRARTDPSGTVWSRFNLSEILPEPTPMTWSIVRR